MAIDTHNNTPARNKAASKPPNRAADRAAHSRHSDFTMGPGRQAGATAVGSGRRVGKARCGEAAGSALKEDSDIIFSSGNLGTEAPGPASAMA